MRRRTHVLLVDPVGERRREVATSLRAFGRRVTEAATPLEALYCLDEGLPPHVMAIADTSPITIGEELRAYVIAEHGNVSVTRVASRCGV